MARRLGTVPDVMEVAGPGMAVFRAERSECTEKTPTSWIDTCKNKCLSSNAPLFDKSCSEGYCCQKYFEDNPKDLDTAIFQYCSTHLDDEKCNCFNYPKTEDAKQYVGVGKEFHNVPKECWYPGCDMGSAYLTTTNTDQRKNCPTSIVCNNNVKVEKNKNEDNSTWIANVKQQCGISTGPAPSPATTNFWTDNLWLFVGIGSAVLLIVLYVLLRRLST